MRLQHRRPRALVRRRAQRAARRNADALRAFLGGIEPLDCDAEDAAAAGRLHGRLAAAGVPARPFDLLIAAVAQRRGLTLVTANTREFGRVPDLQLTHWAEDR